MTIDFEGKIDEILSEIKKELLTGKAGKHKKIFNSNHEGYAVLLKEVDEMWEEIKHDFEAKSILECIQVGAMAVKYICSVRIRKELLKNDRAK